MIIENYDLTFQINLGNIEVGVNPNWTNDMSSISCELFIEQFTPITPYGSVAGKPSKRFALVTVTNYIMMRCPFHELFEYHSDPSFTILTSQFIGE